MQGEKAIRKDIEGLRAIAVGAVVLFHAEIPAFAGGYVGVDVFFVISGFLITGQLVRDQEHGAVTRIRQFYVRRIRRILPAATATILVTLIAAAFIQPPLLLHGAREDAVAAMFFFANLHFLNDAVDYFRQGDAPSLFQHFWSLSVEEQFYLVWPPLLVVAGLFATLRRQALYAVVSGLFVVSLIASVMMTRDNPVNAFYLLPARAWELAAGALLAIHGEQIVSSARAVLAMRWLGLGLIAFAILTFGDVVSFPGYVALIPVVGTVLVIAAGMNAEASQGGILGVAPMQVLGRYSYSVYLWHWPVLILVATDHPGALKVWPKALAVMLGLGLPAAFASYHLVETPFRSGFARRSDRQVLVTGAAILAVGGLFLAVYVDVGAGSLDAGKTAAPVVDGSLKPTSFVPSNVRPGLLAIQNAGNEAKYKCPKTLTPCELGDPTAATTVVVYGDSHSLHWLAAFDAAGKAHQWRVIAWVRPGCPSYLHPSALSIRRCDSFRQGALALIEQERPDLVVISNSSSTALETLGDEGIRSGITRSLQQLPAGTNVVVFGQTPTAAQNVPECLSDNLNNSRACEPKPNSGNVARINRLLRAALVGTDATFVDARPLMCDTRCPTVVGNTLVYRDEDHVTVAFADSRGEALAALLAPHFTPSA